MAPSVDTPAEPSQAQFTTPNRRTRSYLDDSPPIGGGRLAKVDESDGDELVSESFLDDPFIVPRFPPPQVHHAQQAQHIQPNQQTNVPLTESIVKKPNILFVMADQMSAPLLRIYDGNSPIDTPNIDTLASSGIVFENAYTNSPLCAPARFSMCTGKLPSKIGAYDNASVLGSDQPTYAHYLRNQGYETVLAGKMHFIGPDQLHGFERRLTSDIYPGDLGWTVDWDKPQEAKEWYHNMSSVFQAGPCVRSNQLDYDEDVMFKTKQYLYDWVRQDPQTQRPFALTVSLTHPHDPYTISRRWWDKYANREIPMPKVHINQDDQDNHSKRLLKVIDLWGETIPEEAIYRARRAYFGSCSFVDHQLGKLFDVLADCKLDNDTIIVFSGDHGDMLGERGLWYKMSWFEMSARVPLIIHYPTWFQPRRVPDAVSLIDLLPTFVDLAGGNQLDIVSPIDGRSLYGYLLGLNPGKDETYGEYMGEGTISPIVMIRREEFKFIYCLYDEPQLYDLVNDPNELKNLVHSKRLEHKAACELFTLEVEEKWDLQKIHEEVQASQRRRLLCWEALKIGKKETWDYQPPGNDQNKYIRSHIPLDELERRARFPTVDGMGNEYVSAE